ncbi:hypothetical protein M8C21_026408, partial [Ambrosia artemisiifolia]
VGATSDLMLAYVDFFLGGDEKRSDLPPLLHQRFPLSLLFGGHGSYTAPFSLHSDNVITTLINKLVEAWRKIGAATVIDTPFHLHLSPISLPNFRLRSY